jgi:general secretion pathway protein I
MPRCTRAPLSLVVPAPLAPGRARTSRRGFSLLEVMVALAILVVALGILVETESTAAMMTLEAERVLTATDLANAKMSEAMLYMEEEGFQNSQVYESGDFDEWGDDAIQGSDFARELEDYHWEYWISEIDLQLAGDLAGMASELQTSGAFGGSTAPANGDIAGDAGAQGGGMDALGALGMNSEMITQMLTPFIREVRVRVWWGKDSEKAEEDGTDVVVVSHTVNPTGVVQQLSQEGLPQ